MKQKIIFLVIMTILSLLGSIVFHHSDARLLQAMDHQLVEGKVINHEKIIHEGSFIGAKDNFDILVDLMGSEGCDDKDEECLKRRMVAEAHLDYIYTQHHKP